MPQLVPFYFLNQVLFNYFLIAILIYILSIYILPKTMRLFKTRVHITKL